MLRFLSLLLVGVLGYVGVSMLRHPGANLQRELSATVKVSSGGSGGSGVIVGPHTVLSAAHVAFDGPGHPYEVETRDGKVHEGVVTWINTASDLVLLRVADDLPTPAPISCVTPGVGSHVLTIGNPMLVVDWTVTQGYVAADHTPIPLQADTELVPLDLTVAPGNSGGPVFDAQGAVVGLMDAVMVTPYGIVGVSFMVPTAILCRTLPSV